ncbi:dynamin [Sarcoptes scabiei]|nr:dynamin [Sarcoptes scabiei]
MRIQMVYFFVIILFSVDSVYMIEFYFKPSSTSSTSSPSLPSNSMMDMLNKIDHKNHREKENKCEIEILTKGQCLINRNHIKPSIVLNLKTEPLTSRRMKHPSVMPTTKSTPLEMNDLDSNEVPDSIESKQIIIEFITHLLRLMRMEFGFRLQSLKIDGLQTIKLPGYGFANIYELRIVGLDEIKPIPSSIHFVDHFDSPIWNFNLTFLTSNISIDFKVDVDIDGKIFVRNWNLTIKIEDCHFRSGFRLDFDQQILSIKLFKIKSFGDFRLHSEPLSWPFTEIVSRIIEQEKLFIRNIIENYLEKILQQTINDNHFDLDNILRKIFDSIENDYYRERSWRKIQRKKSSERKEERRKEMTMMMKMKKRWGKKFINKIDAKKSIKQ